MSGGYFSGQEAHGIYIADQIEEFLTYPSQEFSEEVLEIFRETAGVLRKGAEFARCVDYLLSSDYGEESFLEAISDFVQEEEQA